jgi:hypothetical protein
MRRLRACDTHGYSHLTMIARVYFNFCRKLKAAAHVVGLPVVPVS